MVFHVKSVNMLIDSDDDDVIEVTIKMRTIWVTLLVMIMKAICMKSMSMDSLILRWDNDDFNDDYHEGNVWVMAMMMVIMLVIVAIWVKMTDDDDDDDGW